MVLLPDEYRGRPQAYVKHQLLDRYIERLAYNLFPHIDDFVYVDGFCGPWESTHPNNYDTSFRIAINRLKRLKGVFRAKGRNVSIRFFFSEVIDEQFEALRRATEDIGGTEGIVVRHGPFEDLVEEIADYIGDAFSLAFIDPKGWKGLSIDRMKPLLEKRGELIVNFMYNHIQRFLLTDFNPELIRQFDELYSMPDWRERIQEMIDAGIDREEAVMKVYCEALANGGGHQFVSTLRVLNADKERTLYHLVYATRNIKGMIEFRDVEGKVAKLQEQVRVERKFEKRAETTKHDDLFDTDIESLAVARFGDIVSEAQNNAIAKLREFLTTRRTHRFEDVLAEMIVLPYVRATNVNQWLVKMSKDGEIELPDLRGRERTPKLGHRIISNID